MSPDELKERRVFNRWYSDTLADADGRYAHMPRWLKGDLWLSWQAAIASRADAERRRNAALGDARYMAQSYRNMLSESGLKVAEMWDREGVKRFHADWADEGRAMTGEERAKTILEWAAAPRRLVANVDADVPIARFDETFLTEAGHRALQDKEGE